MTKDYLNGQWKDLISRRKNRRVNFEFRKLKLSVLWTYNIKNTTSFSL